jgi:hypothetical protein
MTVQELMDELQEAIDEGYASATVVLFATDIKDYGQEHAVMEQALVVNYGVYSGNAAVYITDGS